MSTTKERILEISRKHKLSHLGSCLTSVDIIDHIYSIKRPGEKFILSNGHAALALYVILEKYECKDAEALYEKHGTHPTRNEEDGIYCTTGSLGMGLGIAVGMALANRDKDVYCLMSDGEIFEGSVYEAANLIEKFSIKNLHVFVNWNGWSAYEKLTVDQMIRAKQLLPRATFFMTDVRDYGFEGLEAHYQTA